MVVGFIWVRWVHSCALWGSLGSSGVVELLRARPGGLCVHPGRLGSLACVLVVIGIIRSLSVYSRTPLVSLGSSRIVASTRVRLRGRSPRLVHSRAPLCRRVTAERPVGN